VSAPPAEWTVPPEVAGERLDRALAAHTGESRHRVQRWIAADRVTISGVAARKGGERVRAGERIAWLPIEESERALVAEPGELDVVFEDSDLIVVDKPAGLVVHPGAGRSSGTLVHRLLAIYPELEGVGGPGRPGIVHRLDRGTSGLLVVARHRLAYERLSRAFARREIDKRYLAVVWGRPRASEGRIEAPIGRHAVDRKRMAVQPRGRAAVTAWKCLAVASPIALLELNLLTGRTHQIRVHAQSIGHPLVGDPVYGEARHRGLRGPLARRLAEFPRPALHAWRLAFAHPMTGERMRFEAPLPEDMVALWRDLAGSAPPLA
jgi:23S rRNA pseudouridine1911/1915/1917 synthase